MNKKTLLLILVVPFVIALLGFTNVLIIKNFVEVDISDIKRRYNDQEGFKIRDEGYLLEAEGVVPDGVKVSEGNDLIRYLADPTTSVASINESNGNYYLEAKEEGETVITCSNKKQTKSKSFNAVIYKNGAIIVNPIPKGSGYSVTGIRNFGEYDLDDNNKKVSSNINFDIQMLSDDVSDDYKVVDYSKEQIDITTHPLKVTPKANAKGGEVFIKLSSKYHDYIETTYKFNLIENGVNVYDYLDLLECTNRSEKGEIVCLQTNLESKANTFNSDGSYKDTNVRLFGNEDGLNFKDEVYTFDTTYNDKFITQIYAEDTIKDDVLVGIRVQKDFYGNGYVINGKELTYPNNGSINQYSGKLEPGEKDLFKGPLTFFSIGKFEMPVVKAFGQDNSLMYVDGDNITIDDLIIESTDKFNNEHGSDTSSYNMYNLEYTGTVVDVNGENVFIKNSEIKNGRTGLRVYSSPNFKIKNTLLSTAREFLMKIGCNEYKETNSGQNVLYSFSGNSFKGTLDEFLTNKEGFNADSMVTDMLFKNKGSVSTIHETLNRLQSNLDSPSIDEKGNPIFGQEITIEDCYFHRSGVFSIALDSYFNGCFLYDGTPDYISDNLEKYLAGLITRPQNIGATMVPSKVTIKGDTRFYDRKDVESIDASCLIEERLGEFLASMGFGGGESVPIDSYFPMKTLLSSEAKENGSLYDFEGKTYLNSPVAYYGGGKNLSSVNFDNVTTQDLSKTLPVDILKSAIVNSSSDFVVSMLSRCVPVASGFNSFNFIVNGKIKEGEKPYLFNESPSKNDFISRYKGV